MLGHRKKANGHITDWQRPSLVFRFPASGSHVFLMTVRSRQCLIHISVQAYYITVFGAIALACGQYPGHNASLSVILHFRTGQAKGLSLHSTLFELGAFHIEGKFADA